MKINYQTQLDNILKENSEKNLRPTLLLHACCGPCSSYVLEYLFNHFDITVLYYNPNIYPVQEYNRRFEELKNLYTRFAPAARVQVVEIPYNDQDFYNAIKIKQEPELAKEPEKGERCRRCYELRLKKTFEYACLHNFDYFCTTLSISPFKDAEKINRIGQELTQINLSPAIQTEQRMDSAQTTSATPTISSAPITGAEHTPKWLPSDFKKKGGFKRSLELSTEYNLYRQQYCGCIYSKTNTEKARQQALTDN